jgi:hypothetical protein
MDQPLMKTNELLDYLYACELADKWYLFGETKQRLTEMNTDMRFIEDIEFDTNLHLFSYAFAKNIKRKTSAIFNDCFSEDDIKLLSRVFKSRYFNRLRVINGKTIRDIDNI